MTDIYILFLIFIASLVVFHYFLVCRNNLSKKHWKQVDYIWFSLSIIGLISLASDVRINQFSQVKLFQESEMKSFWQVAGGLFKGAESSYECKVFESFNNSPHKKDYAQNKDTYLSACEWRKKTAIFFSNFKQGDFPEIKINELPIANFSDSALLGDYEWLLREIPKYDSQRKLWLETKKKSSKNTFEEILSWISPLLIAIALALRISKVTGEVKHEA